MCPGTVETQLWKLESMQISMENKQRPNIPRSYSMPPPCSGRWHQESKKPVILINLDMSIPNSTSEIYRNKLHLRIFLQSGDQKTTVVTVVLLPLPQLPHTQKRAHRGGELCHCGHLLLSHNLLLSKPQPGHLVGGRYSHPWSQEYGDCNFLGFWPHQIGGGLRCGMKEPIKISTTLAKISIKSEVNIHFKTGTQQVI